MANKKVSQQLLTLEHKLERQSDTIKNIQENVDNTSKYQDLRQDVLKSQGNSITWWLSVIGIFLMLFTVYGVIVVEDKIDSFDKLLKEAESKLKEAESKLKEIKTHEKNAKKYEDEAKHSFQTIKKLGNPEDTQTKFLALKREQKVKKSGTKLQKLMLKIQQEDYKTAIDLWKYFIGRASYEDDKKSILVGYFNLGYSYDKEGYHKKAIGAFKKAIEIKPDYHEAYYNKGSVYIKLKEYQKAIVAFKKAIKIKPDFYEACTNMGGAYSKLKKYREAIKAYEKAIKIKPDYYEAHYNRGLAYIKLFELQLIQTQDFDQDLVQKFNMHDNADTTTKIFKMLTIFKSIDNGTQVAGWQQAFSQKHQGVLEWNHWEWSNIEKWINSKPNDEKKQALQSALEFFKAQYNPL
ncbi:TPR domain protein, putative component of TonB system [uncultured Gammaproteobacteria bacterium]|nr:TPR domain protein, putative component of TonB system [uncultured Gammaproteobacteria bacterium]